VTGNIGPDYQRLMDQIRAWITAGEYPVGAELPSITELEKITGRSRSVVREAIKRLQADGVVVGQQGKASFVKAVPAQAASERQSIAALTEQVAELQQQMADLRERLGRMEATLATLTPTSRGGKREQAKAAASGGRR
jgi:DNA-binding FadR family transcriptional regulator